MLTLKPRHQQRKKTMDMDGYSSVSDQRADPCGAFEQAMGLSHSVRHLIEHWIAKDVWTTEMTHMMLLRYKPMRGASARGPAAMLLDRHP